jgi:hypothetical protein
MIYAEMFLVSEADEPVVSAPAVSMDHAPDIRMFPDNRLQGAAFAADYGASG